ncbi:hypothetical protein BDZ45DRAFT_742256 [Acephala macrosclerotiorum]|nr:hypothetical protein BDZ45DRAFT_742256 [Acephala macrosclerotiorum]
MAESVVNTASATVREYLVAQQPFCRNKPEQRFAQSAVTRPDASDYMDVPMSEVSNDDPAKTSDSPPTPPPTYESGLFAWIKPKQANGAPIRVVGGAQKGQVPQDVTYDHPCIVLKQLDSTLEGEEKYLAVSVASYSNMPPEKWLKKRSKTKCIRHLIPIDHPNSPFPWPGLGTLVKQKTKQKQTKEKLKQGLNPVVNPKGSRLPALYLDLERKSSDWMDRWKQSYAKLDALLEISASQLRHYKGSILRDDQPRLCWKEQCLAGSELSLLYYGSPRTGKWHPAHDEQDESMVIGQWIPVSWHEDEELIGPSSGVQPMNTTMSGAPLATNDEDPSRADKTEDHDMLDGGAEENSREGSKKKLNPSTAASPDVPLLSKPSKDSRPPMKPPKGYKDWCSYVRNHTDINNYDPFPVSKSKHKSSAQPDLETSPPSAKENDTDEPMQGPQQKKTSVVGSQKRAIETHENINAVWKREKLDISPPAAKDNEEEDLMGGTEMREAIWARKQKRRVELDENQDSDSARKRLKLFDPMEDFRQQNTSKASAQKQVIEKDENVDAAPKKRRLSSAKELNEATQQKEAVGVGNQK